MTTEKVKFFTNREVVAYLLAFFLVGCVIGYAFGRDG